MAQPAELVEHPLGKFWTWGDVVGAALKTGVFWDEQIKPFLDEADPTGTAIDVGAHIGWFTVYLARKHPRVIAVEAHPQTVGYLKENLHLNGITNVDVLHAAAYSDLKPMRLAPGDYLGWPVPDPENLDTTDHPASIAFLPTTPTADDFLTLGIRVDSYVKPGERVTLIKTDAQGADLQALIGLKATITRCRPQIVFEWEPGPATWHGDTWESYETFFTDLRYRVTRIREDLWDFVARPEPL